MDFLYLLIISLEFPLRAAGGVGTGGVAAVWSRVGRGWRRSEMGSDAGASGCVCYQAHRQRVYFREYVHTDSMLHVLGHGGFSWSMRVSHLFTVTCRLAECLRVQLWPWWLSGCTLCRRTRVLLFAEGQVCLRSCYFPSLVLTSSLELEAFSELLPPALTPVPGGREARAWCWL